jgi:hypothetical protein
VACSLTAITPVLRKRHRNDPRLRRSEGLSGVSRPSYLRGLEKGEEDIFPDPTSQSITEGWRSGAAKALERENAAVLADLPEAA